MPNRSNRITKERTAKALRREIHQKSDGKCGICLNEVKYSSMTVDHIIPKSRGGSPSDPDNLQAAHSLCNHLKGNLLPNEITPILRAKISERAKQRYLNRGRLGKQKKRGIVPSPAY